MEFKEFTSIINHPNSAILSVGSIIRKPVVIDDKITIGNTMKLTLACDHRTIDGVTGSLFLQTLKGLFRKSCNYTSLMKNVIITGTSAGIGYKLSKIFSDKKYKGYFIIKISNITCKRTSKNIEHISFDITSELIIKNLSILLKEIK